MSNSGHPLTPDLVGETLGVAGDVPINDSQLEDLTFDHDGTGVIRVTRWSLEDDELASRRFQIVVRDDLTSDRPMSSAEFRVLRENLGLTTQWIAEELGVHHRTARRWDDGELAVPTRAATQLRAWHAAADAAVAAALNTAVDELVVQRADDPTSPWPARWHRHVLARVAAQRPDVTIRFAHVDEESSDGREEQ